MLICNRLLLLYGTLLACSSYAAAFFLNWGSTEPSPPSVGHSWPVNPYYQQRVYSSSSYNVPVNEAQQVPVHVPAIPIQVPLKAALQPAHNVHNVQLVPCLCPISQDEYDKSQDGSVFLNQIKNQQN